MQNPILIKEMSNENRGKKDRKNVRRLALMMDRPVSQADTLYSAGENNQAQRQP